MTRYFYFFLLAFSANVLFAQMAPPAIKNKNCEKLLFHPEVQSLDEYKLPIYTGEPNDEIELKELTYYSEKPKTDWVKKKATRNCLSPNPEDCLVWCLVEVPGKKEKVWVVVKPEQTDEIDWQVFTKDQLVHMDDFFQRKEVYCQLPNKRMSRNICKALQAEGYMTDSKCKMRKLTDELAKGLLDFQTDNSLFTGGLSLETLDQLAIKH